MKFSFYFQISELKSDDDDNDAGSKDKSKSEDKTNAMNIGNKENFESGSVKGFIYKAYMRAANNYFLVFFVLFLFIAAQAMKSGVDYFISIWYVCLLGVFIYV